MNILLINHYAGSITHGMEFRPYYLAREWVKQGHKVRIVAASQSHVRNLQPPPEKVGTIEDIDGIEYLWVSTPSYGGNSSKRAINIFTFAGKLWLRSMQLASEFRPDIVIASSTHPFDIYAAERIARRAKARLVFELHDLWPLSPIEIGGMSPNHPFILAVSAAEKRALTASEAVVSILPATKSYLVSRGMKPDKFFHVPNGIDVSEWNDATKILPRDHAETLERLRGQAKFIVGYAGSHGPANQLRTVLDAAALSQDPQVHFVLVGQGSEKRELIAQRDAQNLKNVTFLDPVPKALVPSLLAQFDVLYFGMKRQPLYQFGISLNKLMDYMIASKPIIQGVVAGNDPVRDAGCGVTIPPEDAPALVAAVEEMRQLDPGTIHAMGDRGKTYALTHHDYRILATSFLNAVAAGGGSGPRV